MLNYELFLAIGGILAGSTGSIILKSVKGELIP